MVKLKDLVETASPSTKIFVFDTISHQMVEISTAAGVQALLEDGVIENVDVETFIARDSRLNLFLPEK